MSACRPARELVCDVTEAQRDATSTLVAQWVLLLHGHHRRHLVAVAASADTLSYLSFSPMAVDIDPLAEDAHTAVSGFPAVLSTAVGNQVCLGLVGCPSSEPVTLPWCSEVF